MKQREYGRNLPTNFYIPTLAISIILNSQIAGLAIDYPLKRGYYMTICIILVIESYSNGKSIYTVE